MLVRTYSCALMGVAAIHIAVEVSVDVGIGFHLVGLPDSAIKESQQRIETALKNYNYRMPGRKIVMEERGWDVGEDEEELFELAMHERQYIDYKEGRAKKNFEKALADAKKKALQKQQVLSPEQYKQALVEAALKRMPEAVRVEAPVSGQVIWELSVGESSMAKPLGTEFPENSILCFIQTYYGQEEVRVPVAGKLVEVVAQQGDKVQKGDLIAFVK